MQELKAEIRQKFGKANKALRRQGFIPAELYGRRVDNIHLTLNSKDFDKVFKAVGESSLVQLRLDDGKRTVLVHDVVRNPLSGEVEHVDFYQVRMDEKTKVHVPIDIVGEAPAIKAGGILNRTMSEIEVEALPGDLPSRFSVDISGLAEMNQSIYVKDIAVPKGVELMVGPNTVVLSVSLPIKEEVVAPPVADVSQVKVETEEKKTEREKAAAEPAPE
ncbi:MAG: 50S ribosomal protein L25 [Patescibacteria group bacterium]